MIKNLIVTIEFGDKKYKGYCVTPEEYMALCRFQDLEDLYLYTDKAIEERLTMILGNKLRKVLV